MDSRTAELIRENYENYAKLKIKIDEIDAEIARLRAILEPQEDYDKCVGEFDRALLSMIRRESERRAKKFMGGDKNGR